MNSFDSPLAFLQALSHEVRWQIVHALAQSDLRVQELTVLLDRPQNFVSYHLKQLRQAGVVQEHRSIADGRDVYYTLDLPTIQAHLGHVGSSIHPGLTPLWDAAQEGMSSWSQQVRILFVCSHNSARSQMAEALLHHATQHTLSVASAGISPTQVHPLAISALNTLETASDGLFAKPLHRFADSTFDYIITVCDRAREESAAFPQATHHIHWSLPDPVEVEPPALAPFLMAAKALKMRIQFFLLQLHEAVKGNAS